MVIKNQPHWNNSWSGFWEKTIFCYTVSLLTTCVHITTKRHISTYRNCDLSLSDEISKYGDFDMSKSDAWTKSAAISQYSTPSSYHGFLSFRYSDIWWLKAIAQCRYSTDCEIVPKINKIVDKIVQAMANASNVILKPVFESKNAICFKSGSKYLFCFEFQFLFDIK